MQGQEMGVLCHVGWSGEVCLVRGWGWAQRGVQAEGTVSAEEEGQTPKCATTHNPCAVFQPVFITTYCSPQIQRQEVEWRFLEGWGGGGGQW